MHAIPNIRRFPKPLTTRQASGCRYKRAWQEMDDVDGLGLIQRSQTQMHLDASESRKFFPVNLDCYQASRHSCSSSHACWKIVHKGDLGIRSVLEISKLSTTTKTRVPHLHCNRLGSRMVTTFVGLHLYPWLHPSCYQLACCI